jgi:hypothetical protein
MVEHTENTTVLRCVEMRSLTHDKECDGPKMECEGHLEQLIINIYSNA